MSSSISTNVPFHSRRAIVEMDADQLQSIFRGEKVVSMPQDVEVTHMEWRIENQGMWVQCESESFERTLRGENFPHIELLTEPVKRPYQLVDDLELIDKLMHRLSCVRTEMLRHIGHENYDSGLRREDIHEDGGR